MPVVLVAAGAAILWAAAYLGPPGRDAPTAPPTCGSCPAPGPCPVCTPCSGLAGVHLWAGLLLACCLGLLLGLCCGCCGVSAVSYWFWPQQAAVGRIPALKRRLALYG